MRDAKIVIATDSGLAHLAVMCGCRVLLITHGEGIVADGVDDVGNQYWPSKIHNFEKVAAFTGATVKVIKHAWHSAEPVFNAARDELK